jgi:hypothetical protein
MSRRVWIASSVVVVAVAALGVLAGRHTKPSGRAPALEFVAVEASEVRADWRKLPLVAKLGEPQTLAVHQRFMTDNDLDQRATLGPFELRWRETGYHSAPPAWLGPRICEPSACDGTSVDVWTGSAGIYRRVSGLRHDDATDTWIVSTTETGPEEQLGVAFRRVTQR